MFKTLGEDIFKTDVRMLLQKIPNSDRNWSDEEAGNRSVMISGQGSEVLIVSLWQSARHFYKQGWQ